MNNLDDLFKEMQDLYYKPYETLNWSQKKQVIHEELKNTIRAFDKENFFIFSQYRKASVESMEQCVSDLSSLITKFKALMKEDPY